MEEDRETKKKVLQKRRIHYGRQNFSAVYKDHVVMKGGQYRGNI